MAGDFEPAGINTPTGNALAVYGSTTSALSFLMCFLWLILMIVYHEQAVQTQRFVLNLIIANVILAGALFPLCLEPYDTLPAFANSTTSHCALLTFGGFALFLCTFAEIVIVLYTINRLLLKQSDVSRTAELAMILGCWVCSLVWSAGFASRCVDQCSGVDIASESCLEVYRVQDYAWLAVSTIEMILCLYLNIRVWGLLQVARKEVSDLQEIIMAETDRHRLHAVATWHKDTLAKTIRPIRPFPAVFLFFVAVILTGVIIRKTVASSTATFTYSIAALRGTLALKGLVMVCVYFRDQDMRGMLQLAELRRRWSQWGSRRSVRFGRVQFFSISDASRSPPDRRGTDTSAMMAGAANRGSRAFPDVDYLEITDADAGSEGGASSRVAFAMGDVSHTDTFRRTTDRTSTPRPSSAALATVRRASVRSATGSMRVASVGSDASESSYASAESHSNASTGSWLFGRPVADPASTDLPPDAAGAFLLSLGVNPGPLAQTSAPAQTGAAPPPATLLDPLRYPSGADSAAALPPLRVADSAVGVHGEDEEASDEAEGASEDAGVAMLGRKRTKSLGRQRSARGAGRHR